MKWQTTKAPCNNCGHVNVSVHPEVCEYLECSICHHMNPAPYIEPEPKKDKTMITIFRKQHKTASFRWAQGPWMFGRYTFTTCIHYRLGPLLLTVDR